LNGSENGDAALDGVHQIIVDELTAVGWEVDPLMLHEMEIRHCVGCFGCWVKTPGVCVINDAGRDVARAVIQSDLVIYLTPVTFGGYSSQLKKALDRSICLVTPFFTKVDGEIHHEPRYERYPRIMGVGVLPQADEESERIFTTLVGRNAINAHTPAHVAGVILSNQGGGEIRKEIQTLFKAVEVGQ
jgi:multimeric flavodoxin WrbA